MTNTTQKEAQPSRECLQQSVQEVDFTLESLPPLEGFYVILAEYQKTYGRTPDAAMAATVGNVKDMLFMWWASHREPIAAALQAATPAPAAVAVSDDLKARCTEILEWQKTGILRGDALREFAAAKYPEHHEALQIAERATAKEAYAALAAAPAQAAYSREEWIAQAAQVFVDDGDDQKAAQDLARWHWNQQDWTSGEIDDPREVAREDLAGREKPTAPAQAVAVPEGWRWMTHPDRNNGQPIPVRIEVEDGVTYYRPFDERGTDFEWDKRGDEWVEIATPAQEHATQLAGQGQEDARDAVRALIATHAEMLEDNAYAYFELAYTRQTGWMAWITDKPGWCKEVLVNPDRKVLAQGQGDTPDEACTDAMAASAGQQADEPDLDAWKCEKCHGTGVHKFDSYGDSPRGQYPITSSEDCDQCETIGWCGPDAEAAARAAKGGAA